MSAEQIELRTSGQPDFTRRFLQALRKPPVTGVFYDNGWNPGFKQGLKKIDQVCKEKQVCDHGMDHLARTAQNAFFLSDLVVGRFIRLQPAKETQWRQAFSDHNILPPVLAHDLGYASDNTKWKKLHGTNHARESAVIFDLHVNNGNPRTAKMIEAQREIFRQAIAGEKQTLLEQANKLSRQPDTASLKEVFPFVVQAADQLDYFHKNRVKHLEQPAHFEDNPYYFLADAVTSYQLTNKGNSMCFEVNLKTGHDLASWHKLALAHYPHVFRFAETVATLGGKNFTILPRTNSTFFVDDKKRPTL